MRWLAIFGHSCLILGCYLIAWGLVLLPVSQPHPVDILKKPLFWGMFSVMGGICANLHSSCRCLQSTRYAKYNRGVD